MTAGIQPSGPPSKQRKGAGVLGGGGVRYKSILFAVVLTALITRHLTVTTVLMACVNHNTNEDIHIGLKPPSAKHKKIKKQRQKEPLDNDPYSFETIPSRAWKPFAHKFPCYPPGPDGILMTKKPAHEGILFQRPEKVGSTTMTNIVMRLAFGRGAETSGYFGHGKLPKAKEKKLRQQWLHPARCNHRTMHGTALEYDYPNRDPEKSFLFGLVRNPIQVWKSRFFHFQVSVYQWVPSDDNFVKYVTLPKFNNMFIRNMVFDSAIPPHMTAEWEHFLAKNQEAESDPNCPRSPKFRKPDPKLLYKSPPRPLNYTRVVADILDGYDFIAVTERMDESLVALKLLLGLRLEEILYAKVSRSAGSFSNGPPKERPCIYLVPGFLTNPMRNYFYNPQCNEAWIEFTKGDALLHRAASVSLDRTIDEVFGRKKFETELAQFKNAEAYAAAICGSNPELVLGMCDESGNSVVQDPDRQTTCYIWSEGCDYKCLNQLVPDPIPQEVLDGTLTFDPSTFNFTGYR